MKLGKIVSITLLALSALFLKATAADTLVVIFDKQQLQKGDSIELEIYSEPYKTDHPDQTLHLWIDNVQTGKRWKYRYAFMKGRCKISLKINDNIPNGIYAFNFLLQNRFLTINGKLENVTAEDKAVNFFAKGKNKVPIIDDAQLQPGGFFTVNHLYYTDSVLFAFSPVQKKKENKMRISIETPIDSVFTPSAIQTEYVTIGIDETQAKQEEAVKQAYVFSPVSKKDKELLAEVLLTTKAKTKRKKYEEENVSGLFDSDNSTTFDFSESDELAGYSDVFSYLSFKIPGLRVETNPENGQPVLYWRKDKTDIYVNEFFDTDFSPYSISMQDIEMIKTYPPGTRIGLDGSGGTVAIYTKRFSTRKGNKLSNYSFYIKGYTPKKAEWK